MTRLQRQYRAYNRQYFRNRLPHNMKVKFSRKLTPEYYAVMGYDETGPKYIWINAHLMSWGQYVKFNLLHEMAHIATFGEGPEHGPRWQKEMRRLARIGAFDRLW